MARPEVITVSMMVSCGPAWPLNGWRSPTGSSDGCWNATGRKAHPGSCPSSVVVRATTGCQSTGKLLRGV